MNGKRPSARILSAEIAATLRDLAKRIITADSDAENMSFYFEYDDKDLFNALLAFKHVWMIDAIHKGVLTIENVEVKMSELRKVINDTYGIDTVELAKRVMEELNGTDTEKNSSEE